MKILLLGDVHGKFHLLPDILRNAEKLGVEAVIQVGDFAFFLSMMINLKPFAIPFYVIDGNHENHEWLHKQDHNSWARDLNLHYMSRGSIKQFGSSTVGFVGGAMHADRKQEGNTSKRTTNYILDVEVREAAQTFNEVGKLDLMVTHSCPHSIGVGIVGSPFYEPTIQKFVREALGVSTGPTKDCGEEALRNLYVKLRDKPSNWIFGHFHTVVERKVGCTNFYCIGCTDGSDGQQFIKPYIFDTETKAVYRVIDTVI